MKKITSLISGSLSTLAFALPAFAQTKVDPCPKDLGRICQLQSNQFGPVVQNVITFIIVIAVIIAVLFLIWGGIQWILSGGDKSKVESARNTIIGAIIGLVIVFLGYFVISIVAGAFGINLNGGVNLPSIIPD